MASGSILAALLVLAVVIFVHELGHFLVAKWCNVEIRTFSMGFGPTLFSRQVGETDYRVALIPLGGYVRMAGSEEDGGDPADSPLDPTRGFTAKSLGQRAAIILAGPLVNLVFAVFVLTGCAFTYGVGVPSSKAMVEGVAPDRPAAVAGLRQGDTVVSIDGKAIAVWDDMVAEVTASGGRTLHMQVVDRDGGRRSVEVTPALVEQRDAFGETTASVYQVGISRGVELKPIGLGGALVVGVQRTWHDSLMILQTFLRLVQGRVSPSDLGGPILVVSEASRHAQSGLQPLLLFMALISINLGVVNLLPIPVLDGGHLAFMAVEGLRGRPLPLRVREYALGFGMALIGTMMLFVMFHDIVRVIPGVTMRDPLVLAIDASGADAGVALAGEGFLDVAFLASRPGGHARTEDLALETAALLEARGYGAGDLTAVGAVVGPGSYTGLRSALAFARGLAFPDSLPAVAVGTLELLAWRAAVVGETVAAACVLSEGRHLVALYRRHDDDVQLLLAPRLVDAAGLASFFATDCRALASVVVVDGRIAANTDATGGRHVPKAVGVSGGAAGKDALAHGAQDSPLASVLCAADLELRLAVGDTLTPLARLVLGRARRAGGVSVEDLLPFYVGQSTARPNRHRVILQGGPE